MNYSLYNERWLQGNYHLHVVAYYFRQWNDYHMDFHNHNQVEIMYVIKGSCTVETMDSSFFLKQGDFILIDANIPHNLQVTTNESCRMLNVEFIFTLQENSYPSFKELALNIPSIQSLLQQKKPYILLKDQDEVYPAFKSLIMELDHTSIEKGYMTQLLLSQILIQLSRLAKDTHDKNTPNSNLYVKKAIDYIHQHYDYNIRVEDIAAFVSIHEAYLQRIFKTHTGKTILEYLTQLRLDRAKMLLTYTDIPIIDICSYIGINSRQYFTFLFKKHIGTSPLEYRKSVNRTSSY